MTARITRLLGGWLRMMAVCPGLQIRHKPFGARVLILAPHPDDEVIGCGGALVKHVENGHSVRVVFLSRGIFPDRSAQYSDALYATRQAEAEQVMALLQPSHFEFMEDTVLQESLTAQDGGAIRALIERYSPDVIYAPSPLEEHPDHISAAGLLARSLQAVGKTAAAQLHCVFYQIWGYTIPNYLLYVADVLPRTLELLKLYRSQLHDYNYISMHRWLRRRWTMNNRSVVDGCYETFWTCRGDQYPTLSQRRWRTLTYRGVWALPYAGLLAVRRKQRFHGNLPAWVFADTNHRS